MNILLIGDSLVAEDAERRLVKRIKDFRAYRKYSVFLIIIRVGIGCQSAKKN